MQGNLHVRFGVGVRVKLPGLHHGGWPMSLTYNRTPLTPGLSRLKDNSRPDTNTPATDHKNGVYPGLSCLDFLPQSWRRAGGRRHDLYLSRPCNDKVRWPTLRASHQLDNAVGCDLAKRSATEPIVVMPDIHVAWVKKDGWSKREGYHFYAALRRRCLLLRFPQPLPFLELET